MNILKSLSILGLLVAGAIAASLTVKTQVQGGTSQLNQPETQALQAACKLNPDSPSCK
jgi:hypothetical protein